LSFFVPFFERGGYLHLKNSHTLDPTPVTKNRFGPDGVVRLESVLFSARGILLLASPGVVSDRRSRDLGQSRR
jgi:hypothetical protein